MRQVLYVAILFALSSIISAPTPLHAQTTCGSIVEIYGEDRYETPIEDCTNPFGVVTENPNLRISFNTTQIDDGGTYPFVGLPSVFTLEGTHPEANLIMLDLYRVVPEGYEKINEDDNGEYSFATAGTYTVVVSENLLVVTQNFLQKLRSFFIPTVYAYPGVSTIVTFTVTEPVEEPVGISNIVFLPGIQASRLYTKVGGNEERLWEPFGDDDVEKLRMTEGGESVHDVYTKDIVDELLDGTNVYKGFVQHLIDLDGASGGPLVTTFPYDWRYDVFDIVKNGTKTEDGHMTRPTDVITTSASLSPTGKVTLIAHSNGGLLAKAIMLKLAEEGKSDLVDKVIFIASPHIGTPKGFAALLHGYDQEHLRGLISSDEKVRSVMKNMPGVYGLLPSEAYLSTLTEPIISFDDSVMTKQFRDMYGFTLTGMNEYMQFLNGAEGREDAGDLVNKPSLANQTMLVSALSEHRDKLDEWTPPQGVEVFNIVGTGLPTAKSIEYKEFKDFLCTPYGCTLTPKIEPVIHFSRNGDETVISKSASFLNNTKHYIDLFAIGEFVHANITESETTQTLIDHILHGSSTEGINFVSTTEPSFSNDGIDVYTIHSPARIFLRDSNGKVTGRTEVGANSMRDIPGSDYMEVGGVKYVIVPSMGRYTITVEGEGSGVYTHMLTTVQSETEVVHHAYTASITPTSIIEYTKTGDTFSTISVDENGDGVVDKNMTLTGEIIEEEITYDDLIDAIRGLNLFRKYERPLLELAKNAERLSNHRPQKHWKKHGERALLHVVEEMLERYKKMRLITKSQYNETEKIIDSLIGNQHE